ncbi:MAG: hypothetical protein ACYCTV_11645, partial [Leptospirales bacterium]
CLQRADGYGYAVETIKRQESAFLPGVNAEVSCARRGRMFGPKNPSFPGPFSPDFRERDPLKITKRGNS